MLIKLLVLCFLFFSCQHGSVSKDNKLWLIESKAQITDKFKDTNNSVSIEIFLQESEAIRMEITALLGYQVGSLLMTPQQLKYAVHPQKIFVSGAMTGKTIKPLFKQEVDPSILWSIIHNDSLSKHGFACQQTTAQLLSCKNASAKVEIEQKGDLDTKGNSVNHQKKVTLENSKLKMIWVFKSKEPYMGSRNETFVLLPPQEYKLFNIK